MTANTDVHTCSYYCERPGCIRAQRDELRDRLEALTAAQRPAAPSETVNVIGMPEFDSLLDHIYEYGTGAEGVVERANAFARAVLAQYAPPSVPVGVDWPTIVEGLRLADHFFDGDDHYWQPASKVRAAYRAALAAQHQSRVMAKAAGILPAGRNPSAPEGGVKPAPPPNPPKAQEIEALRAEVERLKSENARIREALQAIVDEVSDGLVPYSSDSYLPAHLVEQARAVLPKENSND